MEREPGRIERLLDLFGGAAASALVRQWASQVDAGLTVAGVPAGVAREVRHDLGWLAEVADRRKPFMAITHCLCGEP